jgi:hypothetical protein
MGMFDMLELDPAGELADYYLRVGVGFADGRKATNLRDIGTSRTGLLRTHPRCG